MRKLYRIWWNLIDRCYNSENPQFKSYGGRGIYVCDRWRESFQNFFDDMHPTYHEGLQVDRRNNNSGYTPINCRWVEPKVNARNKRTNTWVSTPKGKMVLAQALEEFDIKLSTYQGRVKRGWPEEDLFKQPERRTKKHNPLDKDTTLS